MDDVIQLRLSDDKQDVLHYDTPSTLPQNIAKTERPPKDDVIATHITRFPPQQTDNHASQ